MKVSEIIVQEATAPTGRAAQILSAIDKFASTTPISKQVITLRMEKAIGVYLKFVSLFNLGIFAYQYWQDRLTIDEMIKQGQLKDTDRDPALRLVAERAVVSMMASGIILRIIQWFFRIWIVGRVATAVAGTAAGIFTGGLFSPASIALILAQQAAALYLQRWLATDDGRECVAYIVMSVIDPGVKFLWDLGPGTFVGHLKQLSPEGAKAMDQKGVGTGDGKTLDRILDKVGLGSTTSKDAKEPVGDKSKIGDTSATDVVSKTPWDKFSFYLPGQDAKDTKKTAVGESVRTARPKTIR
jgi:hypothetical protein